MNEQTARVLALEQQAQQARADLALHAQLAQEIQAQLPSVRHVTVSRATGPAADQLKLVVALDAPRAVAAVDVARLKRWLGVRLPGAAVEVFVGKVVP